MMLVRPIKPSDLDALEKFSYAAEIGITNLPKDRSLLHKRIQQSIKSFEKKVSHPGSELYLFILENLKTQEQVGTCGIYATTGGAHPLYFYRQESIQQNSPIEQVPKEINILKAVSYPEGPSEICALYLLPEYRRSGYGRFLSLSRFHFISQFPSRFTSVITAEMRGKIDKNMQSPFWEGFGKHFFQVEISQALDYLKQGKDFIPAILPKWPIYLSLLPSHVQEVIGKTDEHTQAALRMLTQEGFRGTNEYDIFDAGPKIIVNTQDIRTVRDSKVFEIAQVTKKVQESEMHIISNAMISFRASLGSVTITSDHKIILQEEIANALEVEKGSFVRCSLLKPRPSTKES